jgi:hypothetical protein
MRGQINTTIKACSFAIRRHDATSKQLGAPPAVPVPPRERELASAHLTSPKKQAMFDLRSTLS